ncbi:hypothetical protein BD413DRAFT_531658 [Trametes elegans]|nr:hypothetical protein BD413DRAFT_531658 [Trametes elegans]
MRYLRMLLSSAPRDASNASDVTARGSPLHPALGERLPRRARAWDRTASGAVTTSDARLAASEQHLGQRKGRMPRRQRSSADENHRSRRGTSSVRYPRPRPRFVRPRCTTLKAHRAAPSSPASAGNASRLRPHSVRRYHQHTIYPARSLTLIRPSPVPFRPLPPPVCLSTGPGLALDAFFHDSTRFTLLRVHRTA